jgi:hypothetical protein
MITKAKFALLTGCLIFASAVLVNAQISSEQRYPGYRHSQQDDRSHTAQIVALDECDPSTFNAALGPDFCKNVTLGAFTALSDLFAKAAAGNPDPGWDFEPDVLRIKEGTTLKAVP